MTGLYTDPETGKLITTHSMVRTFRRCPKQAQYKYFERLKPVKLGRPLRLGTWMHKLQEVHGRGEDWWECHNAMITEVWDKLFDEEKHDIGDLPGHCERLFRSYLWHYAEENWIEHETEFELECELPDGSIYRCKIDALIENAWGLWIADRKWHKTLPTGQYRIRDSQSALYVWAALRNDIPVQGHVWDYGRSKPPTLPELTKTGLISRWAQLDTDYPTMVKFFKEQFDGSVPQRYREKMRYLKSLRYQHDKPQMSPFFLRSYVERRSSTLKEVAQEAYRTHKTMHNYDFEAPGVERVPDRSCDFMCSYKDLCTAELYTGERPLGWPKRFKQGDPMDYYHDDKPNPEGE